MPKGKPWTHEEEKQLRDLRSEGLKVSEIAMAMSKSEEAVMKKLQRIGLKVVHQRGFNGTTSSSGEIVLPKELYSVEEALGMLAGAMKALQTPGLSKTEVVRLRSLVQAAGVYQVKFAEYLDYRGLEKELFELKRKYDDLAKHEPFDYKPVEDKKEQVEAKKPVEGERDNHVETTQEEDDVDEKGNQNQP